MAGIDGDFYFSAGFGFGLLFWKKRQYSRAWIVGLERVINTISRPTAKGYRRGQLADEGLRVPV